MTKTIAIAADHAGVELKAQLIQEIQKLGLKFIDLGAATPQPSVDYPIYGYKVAQAIASYQAELGIVICGSGIGISIAANRNPSIRAALCMNVEMAELARKHNDANVLALGSRLIDTTTAIECLHAFLNTEFEGGRHESRVAQLDSSSIPQY